MSSAQITQRRVRTEPVMGTMVTIDVRGDGDERVAVDEVVAWLHAVDRTFSTYRPDSAICRIDRGELLVSEASADVRWVLARCEELRRETAGYFDAYAAGVLDPSALVKGWSVERAARILEQAGLEDFCVTAGGDVVCRGAAIPETLWRIGIQHPLDRTAIAAAVAGTNFAVATSGTYERGEHVRDPLSGEAPRGTLSVTVVGPDLGTADAYSTAAFAMGAFGPRWTGRLTPLGYESMTILSDHTVLTTPGFPLIGDQA